MFLEDSYQFILKNCLHLKIYKGKNIFCKICGSILTYFNDIGLQLENKEIRINPNNIYKNLISQHQINRFYNENFYLQKERILIIKKVFSICKELNYSLKTIHWTISYLDSVLSRCFFENKLFNWIILICISLSSKINETQNKCLNEKEIYLNLNKKFSHDIIQKYQNIILKLLNWNLDATTSLDFFNFYFKYGAIFYSEISELYKFNNNGLEFNEFIEFKLNCIKNLGKELINLTLNEYEFYKFSSIAIATSCLALARKLIGLNLWNKNLENLTYLKEEHLFDCLKLIENIYSNKIQSNYKNKKKFYLQKTSEYLLTMN